MSVDPLRRAIDRLVTPHRDSVLQRSPEGTRLTVVTAPGLLQQLRAAVVGGTGAHAGGASGGLDSTRLPFDAGAAGLLDRIDRVLAAWMREHGARGYPDEPERTLVAWYRLHSAAYFAGQLTAEQYGARVRAVLDWADQIEAMFNPPERVPLGAACPLCGNRWAEAAPLEADRAGDRIDALLVEYQRDGHAIGEIRALCRAAGCNALWEGRWGLEDLMAGIARADRKLETYLHQQLTTDSPDTGPIAVLS